MIHIPSRDETMNATTPDVRSIFGRALEIESPDDRSAFLNEACAANPGLRAEVEDLLRAAAGAGDFMNWPVRPNSVTISHAPIPEGPGTRIGPYRLLQPIGEGGMGVVYMAEQEHPVRRKVALKIIKPGMDSAQVVARFEAERQALAVMDHTNIARVYDAGTTESGRPYFVMELVHGVPITKYCDDNQLTPRERLELIVPVCQAIQHAHQKGIIHRDIKPSNVLVTMYDDRPVPKVIDFGVAKAIEQRLTERTLFTQFGALVGTFEYMSPEQAEMNAFGVDTRSDIYSLGVLLYELLTGTTPLERQRLRQAALGELVRLIKEEEPPRPSVRLSGSGDLPKIAAARRTEPARLSKLVRGEVDWIVMKCLEKDRTRRYETASGLARDVARYLHDEPVEACPPSAGYRRGSSPASTGWRWRSRRASSPCWWPTSWSAPGRPGWRVGPRSSRGSRRLGPSRPSGRPSRSGPTLRPGGSRPRQPDNRCSGCCTPRTCNWPRMLGSPAISPGCATCSRRIGRGRARPTCAASSGIICAGWARPSTSPIWPPMRPSDSSVPTGRATSTWACSSRRKGRTRARRSSWSWWTSPRSGRSAGSSPSRASR